MTVTRRDFLKGAALLAAGGAAVPALALGDEVRAESREFRVAGLDPAHDGLRVAQLSDLHVGERTPAERIRAAVEEANRFAPDLVVLTGDYLSRSRAGVGLMREQLGGLRAPTVAVLGNHDHWVDPAGAAGALEGHGYAVLRNQHTVLSLRGAPLAVVGIDDLLTRHADPARALSGVRPGSRLVLAHGPKTADLLRGAGEPLLVLSGHTHGGQVAVPILTPLLVQLMLRETYLRGLYRVGLVQLYVNRGVGNSALRVRINAEPEVTLATLRPGGPLEG
jgi:predicted MPP superfamily phosphohydrolase